MGPDAVFPSLGNVGRWCYPRMYGLLKGTPSSHRWKVGKCLGQEVGSEGRWVIVGDVGRFFSARRWILGHARTDHRSRHREVNSIRRLNPQCYVHKLDNIFFEHAIRLSRPIRAGNQSCHDNNRRIACTYPQYWVTVPRTRDIYIRCRRVPLAEFYWSISGCCP